jgi:periplasmic protein CpxP/Spy
MKIMKYAALVLAVAGVLMAGGLAGAQGPDGAGMSGGAGMGPGFGMHRPPMEQAFGGAGDHGQWWNNANIAKQLNLTDDQRKAMDGIMQDHRLKLIDLQANLERAEVSMGPLMKADTPDRAAIEAQIDKVVTARANLEKANSLFLLDLRMQLKPEQWKQLETLRQQHMARGEHREWGHDGGRPGNRFRGPDGQFRRPPMPPPPVEPRSAPATPPAQGAQPSGPGEVQ